MSFIITVLTYLTERYECRFPNGLLTATNIQMKRNYAHNEDLEFVRFVTKIQGSHAMQWWKNANLISFSWLFCVTVLHFPTLFDSILLNKFTLKTKIWIKLQIGFSYWNEKMGLMIILSRINQLISVHWILKYS